MDEKISLEELSERFLALDAENFKLSEALSNISLMLDDRGWNPVTNDTNDLGVSLNNLHIASRQLRELSVGNPLIKRGYKLRSSYVWGRAFIMPKVSNRVKGRVTNPVNERCLFSSVAYEELELTAYTDGNVFVLGRVSDQQFMRVPMSEVSGVMTDPDNNEVIWAVRRTWNRSTSVGNAETVTRWYYTDTYPENAGKSRTIFSTATSTSEQVDLNYVMFHQAFNSHVGWTFGVPDALPVIAWSKLYREFLENGSIMTRALAQFAYKISSKRGSGANNAAAKVAVANDSRIGATASMGADTDLTPIARGSGYDFDAGRSLASMVAAGLEVSIVALLADPGQSGAYGTAQTLDTPTMKAMEARQHIWSLFYKRILRFLGAPNDIAITWPSIEVEPTHRMVQALAMAWETGVLSPEQYHAAIIDLLDIPATGSTPPEGIMIPNNLNFQDTKSNDAQSAGSVVPGQGKTGAVGKLANGDNQLRDQNL
jgi:hypothetical protein